MYRFLLTRRWVSGFAAAVALAALCVVLGSWQWDRHVRREARNALVTENYDRRPVALADVLGDDAPLPVARTWTPVALTGRYLPEATVVVRNRPLDGSPGYHVLVPLETVDGPVVVVDRGWVPTGLDGGAPDAVPAPPAGDVRVVVRLRPAEEPSDRDAPDGQTYRIDPGALAQGVAAATSGVDAASVLSGAYGELDDEAPPPAEAPAPLPRPELDEGPHLGYALQWGLFAVLAFVGFGVVARRTAYEDEEVDPAPPSGPRRRSDEEIEDAQVAALERP